MKALEREEAIREVAVFGAGLHVTVDHLEAGAAAIRSALARKNLEIRRLEPIPPSMEDLFVALIEAEERKTA
jgi:ABC-2 type transport system ATP-binding protein